ncbi:hypothetical protein A3740_22740 [Oleiphilus sp. HI0068]|uniref:hypothetical protein n=1 Tax=Oleiphilus sp. HI0132 TaxID=1822270 RepID=UPI0007C2BE85|nr:hypothetical protein [Oleiphilus sp. HI0132]KZY78042.1 hypothetical protein A3740_08880 [Oleiphilus sp. HI0068]KZY83185.1 hypothetical protein A3741_16720 [Oleiphilus sp. HI0069]KZZ47329.1 hypothetical protein A3755_16020 [Oleiphilus sp. HI0085]KZY83916.1 hypothetical protein A3740_22740 [Oleiphilus sp. HI0068]KZZ76870.1 hypothetical protein A3766_12805 [Oleiphilus sp. HI0132]
MEIFRITDHGKNFVERETYNLLEQLNTFSLVECKGNHKIPTANTTSLLILDHFDEAKDQQAIWNQVKSIESSLNIVIIVDQSPSEKYECLTSESISKHVQFLSNGSNGPLDMHVNISDHRSLLNHIQLAEILAA